MSPPPLSGWRVVVTRARGQSGELVALLEEQGATSVEVPTIEIAPPRDGGRGLSEALSSAGPSDWVCLTSANALQGVLASTAGRPALSRAKVAVVGQATAARVRKEGIGVDLVAPEQNAESLARALVEASARGRAILPQSSRARRALAEALEAAGWEVVAAEAYETRSRPGDPELSARLTGCEAAIFSSPSSFEAFVSAYGRELVPPVVVSIGPVTTAAIATAGVEVTAEADRPGAAGLVAALVGLAARGARRPTK